MRKPAIKIAIIFFAFFLLIITAVLALTLLINSGKLTYLLEAQISKRTNSEIKIGNIHLDIFTGFELENISFRGLENNKGITLECNTFVIYYTLFEMLKGHIKHLAISGVQINLDTKETFLKKISASSDAEEPAFNLKELLLKTLIIENIVVSDATVRIATNDYLFTADEMNIQAKHMLPAKLLDLSIKGNVSISGPSGGDHSDVSGGFDIKTKYNMINDELNILGNSYLLVSNIGNFFISGKIHNVSSGPEMDFGIDSQGLVLNKIPDLLKEFKFVDLSTITLDGVCDTVLYVRGNMEKLRLKSNTTVKNLNVAYGETVFKAKEFQFPMETIIYPFGPKGKVTGKSKFVIQEGQLWIGGKQMADLRLPINFTMDYPDQMTVTADAIDGKLLQPLVPIKDLVSNIKMNLELKHKDRMPFDASIETLISGPVHITGEYNYEKETVLDTNINVNNIDCNALFSRLAFLIPEEYKDWSYNGNISIFATLDFPDQNGASEMEINTNVFFSGLKFASPDYDYFGENINGNLKTKLNIDNGFKTISFDTNGELMPFLIQLGLFTTDMKNRKTHFSFNGHYDREKELLSETKGTLSWNNLGSITIGGNISNLFNGPVLDLDIEMRDLSNMAFFETFIKDTVEYSHPALFNASVNGESNARFHVSGPTKTMSIDGNINIQKTNLKYGNIFVENMNVDLPISIMYPHANAQTRRQDITDPQYGAIEIKRISCGPVEINNFQTRPIIISNNFFIKDPLKIHIFGGSFNIEDIFIEDMITPDRKINFAFQLEDIDLELVTSEYNLTPFKGNLSSSVISFQQEEDKLYSKGKVDINVFGGDISLSNLTITNFLKPLMEIEFSTEIKHLDLGKISNTFREWGSITGIMNGHIRNFKLVAGEPSSFEIELRTEKQPKGKQTVSAKFLKNFVPGVGKVLDNLGFTNYKYAVIGLRAALKNDYITLKGAVKEEGKELFMKGAGFKKLEIVFSNTERKIKFKKFLNSFKGILGSGFDDTQVEFQ